jgi:hypothetical protein
VIIQTRAVVTPQGLAGVLRVGQAGVVAGGVAGEEAEEGEDLDVIAGSMPRVTAYHAIYVMLARTVLLGRWRQQPR